MSITLPGWFCQSCGVWTGVEKNATQCRACGHQGPTVDGSGKQLLVETLFYVTSELKEAYARLDVVQGRCTELLEESRGMSRKLDAAGALVAGLAAVLKRLEPHIPELVESDAEIEGLVQEAHKRMSEAAGN